MALRTAFSIRTALALVLLALAGIWFYEVFWAPKPFWIQQGDGELVYYFNSLAIQAGHRPPNVSHPGVPMQLLGAFIIKLFHFGPESLPQFLHIGYALILAVTAAVLIRLAGFIPAETPFIVATAVLLSYWIHPSPFFFLSQWSTYALYVPFGYLALASLWDLLRNVQVSSAIRTYRSGFLIGTACALHFFFVPLIPMALIGLGISLWLVPSRFSIKEAPDRPVLSRILSATWTALTLAAIGFYFLLQSKNRLYGPHDKLWIFLSANLFLSILSLFFWGTPTGKRNPLSIWLWTSVKFITGSAVGWLFWTFLLLDRLLGNSQIGKLSTEAIHPASWKQLAANLWALAERAPFWIFLLAVVAVGLLAAFFHAARSVRNDGPVSAGTAGMAGALLVGLPLTAWIALHLETDHPIGAIADPVTLRYFLVTALIAAFSAAWLCRFYSLIPFMAQRIVLLFSILFLFAFGLEAARNISFHQKDIQVGTLQKQAVDAQLDRIAQTLGRRPMALCGVLSRPSCALRWGDANADGLLHVQMDKLFPEERELDLNNAAGFSIPADERQADLIILSESEVRMLEQRHGAVFKNWLKNIGPWDRLCQDSSDPIICIRVQNPLQIPGSIFSASVSG